MTHEEWFIANLEARIITMDTTITWNVQAVGHLLRIALLATQAKGCDG